MIKPAKACAEQPHRGQCRRGGNLMARTRTRLHAPFTLHRGIGIPTQSMGSIKAHVEVERLLEELVLEKHARAGRAAWMYGARPA